MSRHLPLLISLLGSGVLVALLLALALHAQATAHRDQSPSWQPQMVSAGLPFVIHDSSGALFIGISPVGAQTMPPFLEPAN